MVSIPILRVGVQQVKTIKLLEVGTVSIPILRVGVQLISSFMLLIIFRFQFPYCTWEFNYWRSFKAKEDDVSIPILHVGVQT